MHRRRSHDSARDSRGNPFKPSHPNAIPANAPMVSLYDLVTSAFLAAIAGTALVALTWGLLLARKVPPAAFHVRLFRNLQELTRGLIAVDVAVVLLALAFLPGLLGLAVPEAWASVLVAAAAAVIWYGLFRFAKTFRVPRAPVGAAPEEAERGSP